VLAFIGYILYTTFLKKWKSEEDHRRLRLRNLKLK
jgi:hypothetical protein